MSGHNKAGLDPLKAIVQEAERRRPVAFGLNSWAQSKQKEELMKKDSLRGISPSKLIGELKNETESGLATPKTSSNSQASNDKAKADQECQSVASNPTNRMRHENKSRLATLRVSPLETPNSSSEIVERRDQDASFKPGDRGKNKGEPLSAALKTTILKRLRAMTDKGPEGSNSKTDQGLQGAQNRAVIDPSMPLPLFYDQKRDYYQSTGVPELNKVLPLLPHETSPRMLKTPPVGHSASRVNLNCGQSNSTSQNTTHPQSQKMAAGSMDSTRPVQSNPMPTSRYFQENNIPTPTPSHRPRMDTMARSGDGAQGSHGVQGVIMGYGSLNPTRAGTYARVGEVGLVEMDETQRILSQAGVIETVDYRDPSDTQRYGHLRSRGSAENSLRSPSASSSYGHVWENNPRVGHTLPAFSPAQPRHPYDSEGQPRRASSSSALTVPVMLQDFNNDPNRPSSNYAQTNAWGPPLNGNSFAANAPTSGGNGVPPPPAHLYPEYQQAASLQSILAHLEFTLHHHIDACFRSLSRILNDKTDNVTDKLIARFDVLEKTVQLIFKGSDAKIKEIEKQVKTAAIDSEKNLKEVKDLLSELHLRFELLEKTVKHQKHVQDAAVKADEHHPVSHQSVQSTHGRTENTRATHERSERHHQHSTSSKQSPQVSSRSTLSSGHRRSNTVGGTGIEDGARREFFAHLGAAIGPAPSLKDHPAFRDDLREVPAPSEAMEVGVAGEDDKDYPLYHVPSFSHGGWYRQAYGG